MAAAREKLLAHRRKLKEREAAKKQVESTRLLEPVDSSPIKEKEKIKTKIRTAAPKRSALVAGSGQSMGMELD